MADNIHLIAQPLALPKGVVRQVTSSLVHNNRVYAYNVLCELSQAVTLSVDARQLPINIPQLQGQYGEISLYATQAKHLRPTLLTSSPWSAQYLGEQLSLVFFADLLTRYKALLTQNDLPDDQYPEDDGIPEFQDDYAQTLEAYTPQGFCLGDYESAPMLRFNWGAVLLSAQVDEQLQAVAKPGDWVEAPVNEWSLACFKALGHPN